MYFKDDSAPTRGVTLQNQLPPSDNQCCTRDDKGEDGYHQRPAVSRSTIHGSTLSHRPRMRSFRHGVSSTHNRRAAVLAALDLARMRISAQLSCGANLSNMFLDLVFKSIMPCLDA